MKPLSKQVACHLAKDARVVLERHDDSDTAPITIMVNCKGTIYAAFKDSTRISLPLTEYGVKWRFWSALPDGTTRALTPWRGGTPRLIHCDELSSMPRYESYTLEFQDPRNGRFTVVKATVEIVYNDSLLIAAYNADDCAIKNRWNRDVYGRWWRLWIGKPTDQQKEGAPW